MKLIDKKAPAEAVYVIELTQSELNTIIASVGKSSQRGRDEFDKGVHPKVTDDVALYETLMQIGGWRDPR